MTIIRWTGLEVAALRTALRDTQVQFADRIGCSLEAVGKWERRGADITLGAKYSECMDTTRSRLDNEQRARFDAALQDPDDLIQTTCAALSSPSNPAVEVGAQGSDDVGRRDFAATVIRHRRDPTELSPISTDRSHDIVSVLGRAHKLSRAIDPDVIAAIQSDIDAAISQYETRENSNSFPLLFGQRTFVESLLNETVRPKQRQQLFEAGAKISGLIGYILVGRGNFPLARAYCVESFQLSELSENMNIRAWSRGLQSFCEYYAGQYAESFEYARDGLAHDQLTPQGARLMINGVARALGKLGDISGVERAVDESYELMQRSGGPDGISSSITLGCYSEAQIAGNAATAYVSLAMPDSVEEFARIAMPEMNKVGSPWGRSLVMIDLARSRIISDNSDLDGATALIIDALYISSGQPMISLRQRASEFLREATDRWGNNFYTRSVREAIASLPEAK
jgi:hypothetical protein